MRGLGVCLPRAPIVGEVLDTRVAVYGTNHYLVCFEPSNVGLEIERAVSPPRPSASRLMTTRSCSECGANFSTDSDTCESRFALLLALDHSCKEPWGSRHGQAFAAFALQHPRTYASSLDHAWLALYQIYVDVLEPAFVFVVLRSSHGGLPATWTVPARPSKQVRAPSVTIADLGDFAADTYPMRLDAWCRASLSSWGWSEGSDTA